MRNGCMTTLELNPATGSSLCKYGDPLHQPQGGLLTHGSIVRSCRFGLGLLWEGDDTIFGRPGGTSIPAKLAAHSRSARLPSIRLSGLEAILMPVAYYEPFHAITSQQNLSPAGSHFESMPALLVLPCCSGGRSYESAGRSKIPTPVCPNPRNSLDLHHYM